MNEEVEVKVNPDIAYIKRDDIGLVVAKGLAKLYKAQPENPVDYLGKWLLNFANVKNESNKILEQKQKIQELRDRRDLEAQEEVKVQEEVQKKQIEERTKLDDFKDRVNTAEDLTDLLHNYTNHLQELTKATGVYIGKLIKPNKEIQDDDNDTAHLNPEAPELIKYIHANITHDFLLDGKTLSQEQGLSHDVFKAPEPKEGEDEENKALDEGAEGAETAPPAEPPKKVPQHIYVPEVVREPRMHYFKVPRLGSYLAVELKYNSWLHEEAFDKAYEDYLECDDKRAQQDKEKADYEQQILDQKEELGDEYKEPEEKKEWPEIAEKPFESIERKFIVWLDTLGQDRQLTDTEKEFVLDSIQHYSDTWTQTEINNLKADIEKRHDSQKEIRDYLEGDLGQTLLADEEKYLDDYFDSLEEPADEATRNEKLPGLKHQFIQSKLCGDPWKTELVNMKEYRVIKFPRFWQSFFYFLGYTREEICEEGTNKLFWKLAKNKLNDGLFERMKNYTHIGPKEKEYKRYQLINFIEKNIEGVSMEDIESYSYVLSRLYKWMTTYIEMRKDDITRRREIKEKEREERDQAIEDHREWKSKREAAMEDAKNEFETKLAEEMAAKKASQEDADKAEGEQDHDGDGAEETPTFDEEEFYRMYDAENTEVVIPPEIVDDIDNDYEFSKESES